MHRRAVPRGPRISGALIAAVIAAALVGVTGPASGASANILAGSVYSTTYGEMTFGGDGTAYYDGEDGYLDGELMDTTFIGRWSEPSSAQKCDSNSSRATPYWGHVSFVFEADFSSFTGTWGYCDAAPTRGWNGTRTSDDGLRCDVPDDELPPTPADPGQGIHVIGCYLFLNTPPAGVLTVERAALPSWASVSLAVVGATVVNVGPPATITTGDPSVFIDGVPVAIVGSGTSVGGVVVEGSKRILVNGVRGATISSMALSPMVTGIVPHVGGPIISTGQGLPAGVCRGGCSVLGETAPRGFTRIEGDFTGVFPGDVVLIGDGTERAELAIVKELGSLILETSLHFDHPAGTVVVRLPAGARSPEEFRCDGRLATVVVGLAGQPTDGPDIIYGTDAADTIDALGGDDVVCGGEGADIIDGGPGDDRIFGGPGHDQIDGGRGDDLVQG